METVRRHERSVWIGGLIVGTILILAFAADLAAQSQTNQGPPGGTISEKVRIQNAIQTSVNSLRPILTIKVTYPNGSLEASYVDKNDLITNNLINLFACAFSDQYSFSLTSSTNGAVTEVCHGGFTATSLGYAAYYAVGALVQTGTGTTAAARPDYVIQTPYQTPQSVSTSLYDSGTGNLTLGGSFIASTGYTMSEAGLYYTQNNANFLFFHDVFAGIVVSAGSGVSVQYVLELITTGFTNNVGNMLACEFEYISAGNSIAFSATDAGNTGRTIYCSTQGSYQTWSYGNGESSETSILTWMEVGTGTGAASRGSYYLGAAACGGTTTGQSGLTGYMNPTIYSTTQIKLTRSVTCTSATTVTEAGEFQDWYIPSGASVVIMLWRATFTGVSVGASSTISPAVTITVN